MKRIVIFLLLIFVWTTCIKAGWDNRIETQLSSKPGDIIRCEPLNDEEARVVYIGDAVYEIPETVTDWRDKTYTITEISEFYISYDYIPVIGTTDSVKIPRTVKKIHCTDFELGLLVTGKFTFSYPYFETLKKINVAEDNPYYYSENGVLYAKDGTLIRVPPLYGKWDKDQQRWIPDEEFIIPEGVSGIAPFAFMGCSFSRVQFSSKMKEIPKGAFYGSNIETVTIPAHINHIGERAFCKCDRLKKISIEPSDEGVVIEEGAFATIEVYHFPTADQQQVESFTAELGEGVTVLKRGAITCKTYGSPTFRLPASVKYVEPGFLVAYEGLKGIEVATGNKYYKDIDGVLFTQDDTLVFYPPSKEQIHYEIPEGTVAIADIPMITAQVVTFPSTLRCINEDIQYGNFICETEYYEYGFWTYPERREGSVKIPFIEKYLYSPSTLRIFKSISPPELEMLTISRMKFQFSQGNLITIYVPKGSKAAYENAAGWSFCDIREMEDGDTWESILTGVKDIQVDEAMEYNSQIYSLDGRLLKHLQKGGNIIRTSDGNIRKLFVR